jgi:hypothetical protein
MKSALGQGMRRRDKLFLKRYQCAKLHCPRGRSGVIEPKVSGFGLSQTGVFLKIVGDFLQFARPVRRTGSVETEPNARKSAVSGPFVHFVGTKMKHRNAWLGGRVRTSIWRIEIRCSRLSERSCRTCFRCKSKVLRNVGISRTVPNQRSPEIRREMGLSENDEPALPIRSPKLE